MRVTALTAVAASCLLSSAVTDPSPPRHILFFLIDDFGFADASYKNTMYNGTAAPPTPTIDALAMSGVRLESYYVNKLCSPTRTALLSGRYAYTIGQDDMVITNGNNCDLPLNLLTLADRLAQGGWNTSAYGKWDAGMTTWGSTPTCRGFEHYRGFYNAASDYFTHMVGPGFDYHSDNQGPAKGPDATVAGVYTTEAVTSAVQQWVEGLRPGPATKTFAYVAHEAVHGPLQVPMRFIDGPCRGLVPADHPTRLIYCGMVRAVDESVRNITDTYTALGIMEDTLIVFSTDNGGTADAGGNNYPLRGQKATPFEGGVRGLGFVAGAGLSSAVRGTVQRGLMHVTDWLPTLVSGVAGLSLAHLGRPCPTCNRSIAPLDGVDQWAMLSTGAPSARTEVLLDLQATACQAKPIPCNIPGSGAIRIGKWKLLHGHQAGFKGPATPGNLPKCAARLGVGQGVNKTTLPVPANESSPICAFGWNPPPRADGKYELPRPPSDAGCTGLPCNLTLDSKYLTGQTLLFDLEADMFEEHNVAEAYPEVVATLLARLQQFNLSHCGGSRCLPDKDGYRPSLGPQGTPTDDPAFPLHEPVWLPWRGNKDPAACDTNRDPPAPPPPSPKEGLKGNFKGATLARNARNALVLSGDGWCFDTAWPGGGVPAMTVRLSVDGVPATNVLANLTRPKTFSNSTGAPNLNHGFAFAERGPWVDKLGGPGSHRLDVDVFLDPVVVPSTPTTAVSPNSPVCFTDGKPVACKTGRV